MSRNPATHARLRLLEREADDGDRTRDPQLGKLNQSVSRVSGRFGSLPPICLFMRICGLYAS